MNEYKVGDVVRIKGQRGRPQKWIVEQIVEDNSPVGLVLFDAKTKTMSTDVNITQVDFYKEYVKKEKVMEVG